MHIHVGNSRIRKKEEIFALFGNCYSIQNKINILGIKHRNKEYVTIKIEQITFKCYQIGLHSAFCNEALWSPRYAGFQLKD